MSRLQLALRVADLDASTAFFTTLLGVAPHKQRPGYANFASDNPALKLILFEDADAVGQIDHLGIEVDTPEEVLAATSRLQESGHAVDTRIKELCCHAVQDKVWVDGGDGNRWEVYTIVDDEPAVDAPGTLPVVTSAEPDTSDVCC
jgi:catechol 2,3-dioxygenase-like lactoylglutathione lyase family enzyme